MPIGAAFIKRYFRFRVADRNPMFISEYYGVARGIPTRGTIRYSDFDNYFRSRGITPSATDVLTQMLVNK